MEPNEQAQAVAQSDSADASNAILKRLTAAQNSQTAELGVLEGQAS